MKKLGKRIFLCLAAAVCIWTLGLLRDRESLSSQLIRLHVVADSDSEEDQKIKLQVRDAVLKDLEEDLRSVADVQTAKAYLREKLPRLKAVADETLQALGSEDRAEVTLCRENFPTRVYDTFSLPSGIYEALRVTIGSGEGHNWWCVAFPSLCLPAVSRQVKTVAVDAGLSPSAAETIIQPQGIRFYCLDLLGKLQGRLAG